MEWIDVKTKMPTKGVPVLAFFPELSGRGLPIEVVIYDGENRELTDMREHGYLHHYMNASKWCEVILPVKIKSEYKEQSRNLSGTYFTNDDLMSSCDPMGFNDGY